MTELVKGFTSAEKVASVGNSFRVLGRFVRTLPLLHALFYPMIVLSIVAVVLPQLFLWMAGVLTECGVNESCPIGIPFIGGEIEITLALLGWLAVVSFFVRLASWMIFEVGSEFAVQRFHAKMVAGLRGVRTTYFDENPSGRIINRMVNDYELLRSSSVVRMGDSIQALLEVFAIAGMVLIAHPAAAILIVPTILGFLYVQWGVSPMLQRMTTIRSIRLGEVIHRETDLIEGAKTFVFFGAEGALLNRLRTAVHRYVQSHLMRVQIEAWGRMLSNSITSFYSFIAILVVALAIQNKSISIVIGSAIITIILRLTPACAWLSWSVGLLIESVGVTKRAFEIVDLPKQETEEFAVARQAGIEIPSDGELEFSNYSMSYRRDTPVILNSLTIKIPRGTKVGIIGRTGSGKTSLFQSLFRMVYVQDGDILVGGVSLLSSDLQQTRSLFGVVPQDPHLFSGTIRSNLDPDGKVDDSKLRASLEYVGITLPLDWAITEGGRNLSVGERQLVCLARVIAYDRPFVLLDEPTSAVDNITDAKIQETLHTAFENRTVLAIAHRLDTLVNYDLIIEIKEGQIARTGTPEELLPRLTASDVA